MNFKYMYLQKYIYSLIHCKYTNYSAYGDIFFRDFLQNKSLFETLYQYCRQTRWFDNSNT